MNIKTQEFEKINEELHIMEHSSGLKAFVINKKGYSKKYAAFATHYGSINSEFVIPGEKDVTRVPDGVAHFLEHKLFEQKDGSVMEKFSALGSSPNAYTGFNQTVYIFSCTDKFEENFKNEDFKEQMPEGGSLIYRLHFNIEFKKPQEQLNIKSKIDEIQALAKSGASMEVLAKESVNAETIFRNSNWF